MRTNAATAGTADNAPNTHNAPRTIATAPSVKRAAPIRL